MLARCWAPTVDVWHSTPWMISISSSCRTWRGTSSTPTAVTTPRNRRGWRCSAPAGHRSPRSRSCAGISIPSQAHSSPLGRRCHWVQWRRSWRSSPRTRSAVPSTRGCSAKRCTKRSQTASFQATSPPGSPPARISRRLTGVATGLAHRADAFMPARLDPNPPHDERDLHGDSACLPRSPRCRAALGGPGGSRIHSTLTVRIRRAGWRWPVGFYGCKAHSSPDAGAPVGA